MRYYIVMLGWLWLGLALPLAAAEGDWVQGKWEQRYDPDGAAKDYLEFLPNGDVYNIAANGTRIGGMYVVGEDRVTTVFSRNGKDVIATFFFDTHRQELRIVTSRTGKATLYRKLPTQRPTP